MIQLNLIGNWTIKMAIFESMITDLFISMTLLKIGFIHKQNRFGNLDNVCSTEDPSENDPCLDDIIFTLKRANLIVAEHIVHTQRNISSNSTSDTRQILNCSLRESQLQFERKQAPITSIGNRKRLILTLGELEGELPMHAEGIHEVIF